MSTASFAYLVSENWKHIFGNVEGSPHQIIFGVGLTSATKGLGLDISGPMAVRCKNAMRGMIDWINAAGISITNGETNSSTVL